MPTRFGKQVLNIKRTTDIYNNLNSVSTGFLDRTIKEQHKKSKMNKVTQEDEEQ